MMVESKKWKGEREAAKLKNFDGKRLASKGQCRGTCTKGPLSPFPR